jgi:hypothetical protein
MGNRHLRGHPRRLCGGLGSALVRALGSNPRQESVISRLTVDAVSSTAAGIEFRCSKARTDRLEWIVRHGRARPDLTRHVADRKTSSQDDVNQAVTREYRVETFNVGSPAPPTGLGTNRRSTAKSTTELAPES